MRNNTDKILENAMTLEQMDAKLNILLHNTESIIQKIEELDEDLTVDIDVTEGIVIEECDGDCDYCEFRDEEDISTYSIGELMMAAIDRVIFNDPATIILWKDGTKTIVKRYAKEPWDSEKAFMAALIKSLFNNAEDFYKHIYKHTKNGVHK